VRVLYLLVAVLFAVDADDGGGGVVLLGSVVNEFLLHDGVIFELGGLVDAAVEGACARSVTGLSVGLAEHILTLDSGNVTVVS